MGRSGALAAQFVGTIMSRVIAIVACGLMLSACSSSWTPSMPSMPSFSDWGLKPSSSGPQQVTLNVESDPPGADAKSSSGGSCRTPCALALQASGDFTVNVTLNGYLPQSVPVKMVPPEDPRFASEGGQQGARVDPNPIFVELERAPAPAPPAHKKPPAKKRTTAQKTTASAPISTTSTAPEPDPAAQAAPAGAAPWPMPR
jgi:hypothetical protein